MPRVVERHSGSGLHVPGIYRGLMESERAEYERRGELVDFDGRELLVTWANREDHSEGFFLWPRDNLDRLEAAAASGESVVVSRFDAERAMWDLDRTQPWVSVRLPWDRSVRRVRVSSDDRILPAADRVQGGSAR
jgi:hypothetical protein